MIEQVKMNLSVVYLSVVHLLSIQVCDVLVGMSKLGVFLLPEWKYRLDLVLVVTLCSGKYAAVLPEKSGFGL